LTFAKISSLPFEPGFLTLGPDFSTQLRPTPLKDPSWVVTSPELANLLGLDLDFIKDHNSLEILSGNDVPPQLSPFASVYSGHQFGVWAGQLGDGRAITLGHIRHQDQSWEIQLKGAGPTPYSRMGDGRAVLRSSIREFLCSEAMHGLGIPSTRALAVTSSPSPVLRETLETAAVVTRVAPSFIRFGHFEHFASNGLDEQLRTLSDYVITQHYPHLLQESQPYLNLFKEVLLRSAKLVAHWQAVGFCHGVLNTDNMSILGLTLDYGPFGFMDQFSMNHICNHSDSQGRYSFANQPSIFYWNLVRLAQAMLPIIAEDESDTAKEAAIEQIKPILSDFATLYLTEYRQLMSSKLGFQGQVSEPINQLIQELIQLLDANHIDYTYFFRNLSNSVLEPNSPLLRDLFLDIQGYDQWLESYLTHLQTTTLSPSAIAKNMNCVNPKYILRQHLAQNAIAQSQAGDHSLTQALQQCLANPFDEQKQFEDFAQLPPDWAKTLEVSCSS
jgi:uncharacterized protein YdiU (UPF0061 family)